MKSVFRILVIVFFVLVGSVRGGIMDNEKKLTVAVGSKNPVKVNAAQYAFEQLFPGVTITMVSLDVSSGVSAQPMSDEESIRGASNRARKAQKEMNADFGVGIEGSLQKIGEYWFDTSWTVVCDAQGKQGVGASGKLMVPAAIMQHIHNGLELGHACDLVFNTSNVKQKQGFVGLMTNNVLNRTSSSMQSVIASLAAYLHAE